MRKTLDSYVPIPGPFCSHLIKKKSSMFCFFAPVVTRVFLVLVLLFNWRFVQRVDVVKDLLTGRLPPLTDGGPNIKTIQARALNGRQTLHLQ